MISAVQLLSAFLMGLVINFDFCPLAGDFAILSYIVNEAKTFKKTFFRIVFYSLGRITAYLSLTVIIYLGLSQARLFLFSGNGEKIIGIILIAFGLMTLRNQKHCHEHDSPDSKKNISNKSLGGSFLWGLLFSLGFCPHSAAIFFGIFIPMAINSPFNYFLPVSFALGASSVIIFFSLLLSFSPIRGRSLLEKMEQKEKTTKQLVALIFIVTGLIYLIK